MRLAAPPGRAIAKSAEAITATTVQSNIINRLDVGRRKRAEPEKQAGSEDEEGADAEADTGFHGCAAEIAQ